MKNGLIEEKQIKNKIHTIRGLQVMLDRDLAELYGVLTGNLNKAVKRNIERFPEDFMFQLTGKEFEALRSQIVTLNNNNLRFQTGISKTDNLKSQNVTSREDNLRSQNVTSNTEASLRFQNGTLEKGRGREI